ncbi:MAG: hypothetical protein IKU64_01420 [Bacteroides sp.]|nr:hypothetical protein [Bacteroides sp.]
MKNYLIITCLFICLLSYTSSCSTAIDNTVERHSIEPTMVKTELMTSMPGELLAFEDKLVWFDLNPDAFLHIENAKTGENIQEIGRLGGGPEDFTAPFISWFPNRKVLVTDCFAERAMILSLDSITQMKPLDIPFSKKSLQCVGENLFVQSCTRKDYPFTFWVNDTGTPFGCYPLDNENVNNVEEVFQGIHAYNPHTGYLVQSFPELSQVTCYKLTENQFVEKWTKRRPGVDYQIDNDGILRINNVQNPAPSSIALTKDYIITIERDEQTEEVAIENHSKNRFLRSFSKAPQTLFVYNYDFQLLKILHTRIPMFRLAASGNNNIVYFIGVQEEFCIAKYNLDE